MTLGVSGVFWKGFQLIHRVGSFFGQYLHFAKSRLFIWDELNELGRSYQWWGMGPHTLSRMLKEKYFLILLPDHSGLKKFPFVHPHNIFFELKGALGTVGYWLAIGAFLNEIFKLYQNPSAEPCSFRSICMIYILFCMNFYSFFREGNILFVWTMLLIMINAWYEKKDSHRSLNTISPQEAVMPT